MSLVREALEKAEREAAARAAREKGLPSALSSGAGPYRAPRRRSKAPFAAVAALALLALIVSAWMIRRSAPARPAPPASPAASDSAVELSATKPSTTATAAAEPEPEIDPVPAAPAPGPSVETSSPDPPTTTVAPAPASEATPARREFLRRAELGDGRTLELGGVAWSETTPLAYLNGRLRGVGEVVEGFRVDVIEPQAVELSGDSGRLRIRLR